MRGTGPDDDEPYLLAQLQDTSSRKSHEHRLERLALHDPLTGVLNRRGLIAELERQAALAPNRPNAGAVLLCDLDHLKLVNDQLGHEVGDDLLVRFARVLQLSVRNTDVVGRLGGDEFAVILPDVDLAGARAVGRKIERDLAAARAGARWRHLPVSVSVGVACFDAGRSVDEVLDDADRAMYVVKSSRRGHAPRGGS